MDKFVTYPIPEFNIGEEVSVRNHTTDVLDSTIDVAYWVVCVIGRQLEWMDESSKTCNVNVQDVQITYSVNKLIVFTWW